jgi:cytochrome c553
MAMFGAALAFYSGWAVAADVEAGRKKAELCAACHGTAGNSHIPANPSLAGQPAQSITLQLFQFREGNRKDPQMTPVAANLSNADMNDLAAYFSRQPPAAPSHQTNSANATAGRRLAEQHHCTQCHGPALLGLQHIPRLAGQQAAYLKAQLRGFKARTRGDFDGNMTSAAQALSEADIDILADYLSGLGSP